MPNRCFVPNCQSGYPGTEKKNEKIALFSPPCDPEAFKLWEQSIPRKDTSLKSTSKVCSRHFADDDIIKGRWIKGKDGKDLFYPWNNWTLKKDAIPRIFPGCAVTNYFTLSLASKMCITFSICSRLSQLSE